MTVKAKWLMEDWAMDALAPITYSTCLAALPAQNLRNPDPTVPVQTPGTTLTLSVDTSAVPHPMDLGLFIGNHNLTPSVSIHVLFDTAEDFSTPAVDLTMDLSDFVDDTNYLSTSQLFNKLFLWLTEAGTQSYDWMGITINDSSNPDGYLRIGILSVGPIGSDENFTWGFVKGAASDEVNIKLSDGGEVARQDKPMNSTSIAFQNVGMDMLARIRRWMNDGGYDRERWIALSPNGDEKGTFTYYGRVTAFSGFNEVLKDSTRGLESFSMTIEDLCPMATRNLPQITYTDYAGFVGLSVRTDVFLVMPLLSEAVTGFVVDSGARYKATYPVNSTEHWQPVRVSEDGVLLTRVSSKALCASTAGSWFFDLETERVLYVHSSDGADPDTHIIKVAVLFAFCTAIPASKKWLIMDVVIDGFTIANVCFEKRLTQSGLGTFTSGGESIYFGVSSTDSINTLEIINDKQRYRDTHGRMDTFVDRFKNRDDSVLMEHGDGGVVLSFSDHLDLDSHRILSVKCNDERYQINFDSSDSVLTKKLPEDFYGDGTDISNLDYRNALFGRTDSLQGHRTTETQYDFSDEVYGGLISNFVAVAKDERVITTGFTADTSTGRITFDIKQDVNAKITATVERFFNMAGTVTGSTMKAGAMIRTFMRLYCDVADAEIPDTSFVAIDTVATPIRHVIGGNSQQLARETADLWCHSLLAILRHANGIWEGFRHDSSVDPVATIYADDIIVQNGVAMIEKYSKGNSIYRKVRAVCTPYEPLGTGTQKSSWGETESPTAAKIYKATETWIIQTMLAELADAIALSANVVQFAGIDPPQIQVTATGEAMKANYGDAVLLYRPKGFDATGEWTAKKMFIEKIEKDPGKTNGPGTFTATLEESVL